MDQRDAATHNGRKRAAYRKRRYVPEEQRRKDILEAALQVFGEKGYYKTKIEDIAVLAGVAHGTVYRYFPSKSALAMEIIGSRGATGFLETLGRDSLKEIRPAELLGLIAEKYYGNLNERLPLMRFQMAEAVSNPDLGRSYYRTLLHRLIAEIEEIVREYQRRGELKKGDPFLYGHIFYGLLFSLLYCQEMLFGKEVTRINVQEIIPRVVDIFLHGVASPLPCVPPKQSRS